MDLDSARNRTGDVWHVWVQGIGSGQLYAYRVDGPYEPSEGHRFNFNRLLLDPFATAISRLPPWDFAAACGYDSAAAEQDLVISKRDDSRSIPKCVIVNEPFEWNGDQPLRHMWSKTIIYEMHVRGLTIHPQSGADHPGTYRGLTEKIPYLKTLGITDDDPGIEMLRKRQIKNFLLTLMISRGVPMLLGGDEFRRTQGGNNNAYCQDNETSWIDWANLEQYQEIYRFVRGMIAFRSAHPVLSKEVFYTDAEIHWFGPAGGLPNSADPKEKQFACLIQENEQDALFLIFNPGTSGTEFRLPPLPIGTCWHRAVDTDCSAPQDLVSDGEEARVDNSRAYPLVAHSSVILLARKKKPVSALGSL
jgi:pullulanase/glycogen debranching enzyme